MKTKSKKVAVPSEIMLEQQFGQGVLFPGRRVSAAAPPTQGRHRGVPA